MFSVEMVRNVLVNGDFIIARPYREMLDVMVSYP